MKKINTLFILSLLSISLVACGNTSTKSDEPYQTISKKEAKEMMDDDENILILDVRTSDEFLSGHM